MRRKMVLLVDLSPENTARIRAISPDWEITGPADAAGQLSRAEVVVGWSPQAERQCMVPGSPLRWVQSWGAGVNRMPLQDMKSRGIVLTNTSGIHAYPISEMILAMMLNLTRNIQVFIRDQTTRAWVRPETLPEMHEKTLGILGVGAIGEETARLAKAFRMKVLGIRQTAAASEWVDAMYDVTGLRELLKCSDYVVNCLPSTTQTRGIMGREQFADMKPTAYYMSVGRGDTTVTADLIRALEQGQIAGAGLDVFDPEPLPADSPLWSMDNVIITPHVAGISEHYEDRAVDILVKNFQDYLRDGQPGTNRINLDLQY